MLIDMYSLVESVIGSSLLIWGIAILINNNIILSFFKTFTEDVGNNKTLIYLLSGLFLTLGLITIWVHNDWYLGVGTLVTLIGWILTVKSSLWLLFPNKLMYITKKFSVFSLHPYFMVSYGLITCLLGLIILSKYYI